MVFWCISNFNKYCSSIPEPHHESEFLQQATKPCFTGAVIIAKITVEMEKSEMTLIRICITNIASSI